MAQPSNDDICLFFSYFYDFLLPCSLLCLDLNDSLEGRIPGVQTSDRKFAFDECLVCLDRGTPCMIGVSRSDRHLVCLDLWTPCVPRYDRHPVCQDRKQPVFLSISGGHLEPTSEEHLLYAYMWRTSCVPRFSGNLVRRDLMDTPCAYTLRTPSVPRFNGRLEVQI